MAEKIRTYEAKDVGLKTSNAGYSAREMAGRRIGPFYQQTAQGQRELGRTEQETDEAIGKSVTAFYRFQGLGERGGTLRVEGLGHGGLNSGFGGEGTGNGEVPLWKLNQAAFATQNQMSRGAPYLSAIARQTVAAQSPATDVENGVTVFRGGGGNGQTDVENGVTVFRGGGGPVPAPQTTYGGEAVQSLGQPTPQQYNPSGPMVVGWPGRTNTSGLTPQATGVTGSTIGAGSVGGDQTNYPSPLPGTMYPPNQAGWTMPVQTTQLAAPLPGSAYSPNQVGQTIPIQPPQDQSYQQNPVWDEINGGL